jgi:Flp pilus assembly protein TadG
MRLTESTTTGAQARRGASATELAIVLPVLTLMALGAVDFGRFAYHYIAVQNAARAGAEYAITTPYTPSAKVAWEGQIRATARAELEGQTGMSSAHITDHVTVTVPAGYPVVESSGLRRVRVEVSYDGFETLVSWPGIPNNPTLGAAVEMRAIR